MDYSRIYVKNQPFELTTDYLLGFERGNAFSNLYIPYKQIYKLNPKNEKENKQLDLQIVQFYLIDLGLYLDNFPNNADAIEQFSMMNNQFNSLLNGFETTYGPLCLYSNKNVKYPYSYVEGPWPWERDSNVGL